MFFAQKGKFGGAGGAGGADDVAAVVAVVVVFLFLLVWLAVVICFLISLSKCLKEIRPRNRTMEPGQVWLNLVPCLNIVWTFITVIRISESLTNEYEDRRLRPDGDFGKGLGITTLVLNLCGNIPYIGVLFGIAALICFILYWVKIAGYSRRLREDGSDEYRDDGYGDRPLRRDRDDRGYRDEDDRPSRRDYDDR